MEKHEIEEIKKFIETTIKDTAVAVKNSSEVTNSNLIGNIKKGHTRIGDEITAIKEGAKLHSDQDDINFKVIHDRLDQVVKDVNGLNSLVQEELKNVKNLILPVHEQFVQNTFLKKYVMSKMQLIILLSGAIAAVIVILHYIKNLFTFVK